MSRPIIVFLFTILLPLTVVPDVCGQTLDPLPKLPARKAHFNADFQQFVHKMSLTRMQKSEKKHRVAREYSAYIHQLDALYHQPAEQGTVQADCRTVQRVPQLAQRSKQHWLLPPKYTGND